MRDRWSGRARSWRAAAGRAATGTAATVILGALVAACGGGHHPIVPYSSDTAPTSSVVLAGPAFRSTAIDTHTAAGLVLGAADLPGTWTSSPAQPQSASDRQRGAALASCLGFPDPASSQTAYSSSPTFSQSAGHVQITATTFVYRSVGVLQRIADKTTSNRFPACFRPIVLGTVVAAGLPAKLSGVSVTPESAPASVRGVFVSAFDAVVNLGGAYVNNQVDYSYVTLFRGRVEVQIAALSIATPISTATLERATEALGTRLDAAGGAA